MPTKARNRLIELAYDVQGDGPHLLLIAGTASTRPIWTFVRPKLARSFRTIAYDPRSSGESATGGTEYGIHDLVADALAVLDAAGVQRAHILGHSLGGAVAQELAIRHPQRCASLTLVCSWARNDGYTRSLMELMAALTAGVRDDRTLLAAILFAGATPATLRSVDLFRRTDAAMALGPLASREALLRQWQICRDVDTLDRLTALQLPAHVVWSADDRLLPPPASQQLVEAIPGAIDTRIDGCGHLPMVDAPDRFIEAVAGFLRSIPG